MRTLASLGMGEGQLCSCAVVVRCWRWGCAGANESIAFFWQKDARNGWGEGESILVIAGGFVGGEERKKERMNQSICRKQVMRREVA